MGSRAVTGIGTRIRAQVVDTRTLRHPAFRRLVVGQGTAWIGAGLTQVAVPVQVYAISGSSFLVGMVGLAGFLPIVLFGLYGGAIADAFDRRRLYLWSSILTWVVTLLLLLQTLLHVRSVALILGLIVVQAAAFAVASSARGAITPRLVDDDEIAGANTLFFTVANAGQVLGPLIAGGLLSLSNGFGYAYGCDALLFTAALYSTFRLPHIAPLAETARPGLRSVVDGLQFIATRPVLIMSFALDLVAMIFAMPRSLFPQVAAERFHGSVGLLYAAIPIGSLLAGLASGWIGRVTRQGIALTVAIVAWGLCIGMSGLTHQLWLVLLLLAVAGAADLVSAVFRQTILQTYAPDEMRGRMQGVFVAVVAGGPRFGDLRAGGMAATVGVTLSWAGGGFACAAIVLVAGLLVRPFWKYRYGPSASPDVAVPERGD